MATKSKFGDVTRRQFLEVSGGVAAAMASSGQAWGAADEPSRAFEHGRPLQEFSYGQVSLAPGLQQSQLEDTHSVLMGLNDDSLMRVFRLRAGLPAPGCDLQGWYPSDVFGGETFGQWISALSRHYAITRDPASRAKVAGLLTAFSEVIEPTGKLFGDPKLTGGCAYHYDKLTCGLMDAHQFAQDRRALEILNRATQAVVPQLPGRAMDQLTENEGAHESYTIPENQFITWQRGGSEMHLEMAKQYLYHSFFDPLAHGENVLGGRHAYSHVNALCSAAKAYLVLGDEKYLRAAQNGFDFLTAQSFVTGGWGPNETFLPSPGPLPADSGSNSPALRDLGDSLRTTHWHFETPCGSYAHFKLTRYLLRITKNARYGDSMERVMLNTVLGAKPLQPDGRAFYQADYNSDAHKFYYDGYWGAIPSEWPCCSGTLPQIAADYRISSYLRGPDGVYVNLYVPSTLTWQQNGSLISLAQSGSYPLGDVVTLVVGGSRPVAFALHLRIPAWAQQPSIHINGKRETSPLLPGTFATVQRHWRPGDRIELELPRKLELKAVDSQHPDTVALVYGPLALFAISAEPPRVTRQQLLAAERHAESSDWWVDAPDGRVRFTPFWTIKNERYSLYLPVV